MTTRDHDTVPDDLAVADQRAIQALLTSRTIAEAAEAAGLHERTLRRWLAERDDFKAALRREQRAVMAAVTTRLQQSATTALDTLEEVMGDASAPPASRVSAARAVLDLAHERIDVEGIQERLDAIERKRGAE